LHRDVAVKVVNKDARLDSPGSQHLLHEARASSSLSHPNICTIHEVGETDGDLYIVMELVEGKSLRAMSADAGLPPQSVLRYRNIDRTKARNLPGSSETSRCQSFDGKTSISA
jgi:serine/threonine-protein kinase